MSDAPIEQSHPSGHTDPKSGVHHGPHEGHVRSLIVVYIILMVLLFATVGAAFIHLGPFNIVLAMLIALTKAALVVWIFMHVKHGGKLVWIFATAAFVWLGIMVILTFADYMTRSRLPRADDQINARPLEHRGPQKSTEHPRD